MIDVKAFLEAASSSYLQGTMDSLKNMAEIMESDRYRDMNLTGAEVALLLRRSMELVAEKAPR